VLIADRSRYEQRLDRSAIAALVTDERLLIGGIVLLSIALRFVAVGSRLNIDDGYSWLVGSAPSPHLFLQRLAASENTPPLFYVLLAPLPLGHPAWLRIPAALPGVLMTLVVYWALRRPLGVRVALLAALGVAVAPLLVTYSDLARGFMLEDLALLVALWAMLRLADGGSRRWWLAYLAAGAVAMYTEYDAALFLLALTVVALWLGTPERRWAALLGPLPVLTLAPWIPQIVHGQHAVNITKLAPTFPGPSLDSLRDATVTLAFGEYGGTHSPAGRWLGFGLILALVVIGVLLVHRRAGIRGSPRRRAIVMLAGTALLTLLGHAIAAASGVDLFNERYLTILIPLVAALGAVAVVATDKRVAIAGAAILLLAVGLVNLGRRYHHQWEPSLAPVRTAALRMHPRTVLTDTPTVLYYLGSLRPQLDRPFNLGPGRAQSCARPCLIIDDLSTQTGSPRPLPAAPVRIGRFEVTLER
jgi:4-amino-4-deoxy-L-arabinose transferase-like glycosyltransferase